MTETYNGLSINSETISGSRNMSKIDAQASPPKPNVLTEYGELQQALNILGETADQVRVRLQPILGEGKSTAEDNAKSEELALSPFGDSIRSDTRKVYRIRGLLLDLLDRIEL